MRERIDKGAAWLALLAIVASVFGMLVWAAFGRDHTHTQVVTKKTHAHYQGVPSLAEFMGPTGGGSAPCPKGLNPRVRCYTMTGDGYYMFVAALP